MGPEVELYFRDAAGARYRVYDVAFGPPHAEPGKRKVLELGDTRARYRLFVPAEGEMLRSHDFTRGGDRSLTAENLAQQLAGAAFAPKKSAPPPRPDPGTKLGQ